MNATRIDIDHAGPLLPLLISTRAAAKLVGVGQSTFLRNVDAGIVGPSPVKFGGRVLWRVEDLRRWVDAGLPDRAAWEAIEENRRTAACFSANGR